MKSRPTYEKLEQTAGSLTNRAPAAHRQLEEALRKRTKELKCLYTVLEIVNRSGITLGDRLQQIADALPLGWQYSEVASARVTLEGETYASQGFSTGFCRQSSDIIVYGTRVGAIEVYYGEQRPNHDEGPFFRTERDLINAIARRIGSFIERRRAEEERQAAQEQLQEALTKILIGFLPICSKCKRIRSYGTKWVEIESYIREHTEVQFSHSICPECAKELYPNLPQKN